eukprot:1149234-Pelagomonas_calceolata.AAC.17
MTTPACVPTSKHTRTGVQVYASAPAVGEHCACPGACPARVSTHCALCASAANAQKLGSRAGLETPAPVMQVVEHVGEGEEKGLSASTEVHKERVMVKASKKGGLHKCMTVSWGLT